MAGNRRIVVGGITQGPLKGKALGDALYSQLNNEQDVDGCASPKKKPEPKKKSYAKRK